MQQFRNQAFTEDTFRSTVNKVDGMFLKHRNEPVCQERRHAVLQCYAKNKDRTLVCADEVKAFASCVESVRLVRFKI